MADWSPYDPAPGPLASDAVVAPSQGILVRALGGMCPVQGDGTIDGCAFYFRARGTVAQLSVALTAEPEGAPYSWIFDHTAFFLEAVIAEWPNAGYISDEEALGYIERGAQCFRWARAEGLLLTADDHQPLSELLAEWGKEASHG